MKKLILLLFMTIPALFILPACSKAETEKPDKEVSDNNNSVQGITETESFSLNIPGISREYRFLYITDAHMVAAGDEESEEIRNYAKEREGLFYNAEGETSVRQFDRLTASLSPDMYDGLLLGGDLIDSPSASNMAYLKEFFSSLSLPYLYTPGNHDWTFPWEYMTEEGRTKYLEPLSIYMEGNSAIHSLEFDDLILVAVDNSSNQIDPSCLDAYRLLLEKNKPVILMLHVPLMTDSLLAESKNYWNSGVVLGGGVNGGIYPNEQSAELIRLTTQADSPVAAILAGHVHFTHRSEVEGEKSIPQYVGGPGFQGIAAEIVITE